MNIIEHNKNGLVYLTADGFEAAGGVAAVPTVGRSMLPVGIIGAVTMKITSSTSMTSMYGTTLISFLSLRRLRIARHPYFI